MEFVQNTFVTMFDGSPDKALRAVLTVMGVYVLTAAPLVAWVAYGLFQKDPKVYSFTIVLHCCRSSCTAAEACERSLRLQLFNLFAGQTAASAKS